jgi:hypothetical protein
MPGTLGGGDAHIGVLCVLPTDEATQLTMHSHVSALFWWTSVGPFGPASPWALIRVTGIAFVPAGPHNGYADGAWLTPAGYDRIFAGSHYAFKFHVAAVALRPGADAHSVARRLNAAEAAIKGGGASPRRFPAPGQLQLLLRQPKRRARALP